MKSLKINALLNTLRSVLNIIFPLITFPYVSRILGADNLGIYNFSSSFVSYFILIAGLGINTYAIREGAKYRDNREEISNFSSEVFSINMLSTLIAYILLITILLLFKNLQDYTICIIIFSIQIFFSTIGTEWIYIIYEDYSYITLRSIVFKIISMFLLFVFVKNREDCLAYSAITVFSSVGSNILNYVHVKRFLQLNLTLKMKLKRHLKPIMILFVSGIAIQVYVSSDITILGIMKGAHTVGIYSVSSKIYSILKMLLSAALVVYIPRLSMLFGKKQYKKYNTLASSVLNISLMLIFPISVGLILVSKEIVILLAGIDFIKSVSSLQLLSLAIIPTIFGWFYTDCVLIPAKKEKIVMIANLISAVVNIILTIILIPYFSENAAAFTTVVAEVINMLIVVFYGIQVITIDYFRKNLLTVLVGTFGVIGICMAVDMLQFTFIYGLIVKILLSILIYFIILLLLKNRYCISTFEKILGGFSLWKKE